MFVEALKRQNPALISAALSLWQQGKIPFRWSTAFRSRKTAR